MASKHTIIYFTFLLILANLVPLKDEKFTLQELLQRHTRSFTDTDSFKNISSMTISGLFSIYGHDCPMIAYRQRPNLVRLEIKVGDEKVICIYNGRETCRLVNYVPQSIDEPLYYVALMTMNDFDILPFWTEEMGKIDLTGKEELDGKPVWIVHMTGINGAMETRYIDCATFQLLRITGSTRRYGSDSDIAAKTILFNDYQDFHGIMLPGCIYCDRSPLHSEIKIKEVDINTRLDPALFQINPSLH